VLLGANRTPHKIKLALPLVDDTAVAKQSCEVDEDEVGTVQVTVDVPRYSKERGLPRRWPDAYYLAVRIDNGLVTIEGDAAGLRGLAVQLLSLAQDETPPGYAHDLDGYLPAELEPGSTELVLLRARTPAAT
jgi:hypothetical protein